MSGFSLSSPVFEPLTYAGSVWSVVSRCECQCHNGRQPASPCSLLPPCSSVSCEDIRLCQPSQGDGDNNYKQATGCGQCSGKTILP